MNVIANQIEHDMISPAKPYTQEQGVPRRDMPDFYKFYKQRVIHPQVESYFLFFVCFYFCVNLTGLFGRDTLSPI
jgi:hypothetical protein